MNNKKNEGCWLLVKKNSMDIIITWIIYFKMIEFLYYLFYFYLNYIILLFTIYLKLSI